MRAIVIDGFGGFGHLVIKEIRNHSQSPVTRYEATHKSALVHAAKVIRKH